ncbi:MAG: hypothetical protein HA494_07690 [Thaumarchaeota archaeon]|nr:hypothetical protein [Nitrososphaerota archaeon]
MPKTEIKKQNLNTRQKLTEEQIRELQKFVLRHFFSPKLHTNNYNNQFKEEKEEIAEALIQRRLKPTYLIWRKPNIKPTTSSS